MRPAAKLYPRHEMMFSPPFLISSPAPPPRSSHATLFVTSNAPSTVLDGFTAPWTHWTSRSGLPASEPHASQFPTGPPPPPPPPGGGAITCAMVWNDRVSDQG